MKQLFRYFGDTLTSNEGAAGRNLTSMVLNVNSTNTHHNHHHLAKSGSAVLSSTSTFSQPNSTLLVDGSTYTHTMDCLFLLLRSRNCYCCQAVVGREDNPVVARQREYCYCCQAVAGREDNPVVARQREYCYCCQAVAGREDNPVVARQEEHCCWILLMEMEDPLTPFQFTETKSQLPPKVVLQLIGQKVRLMYLTFVFVFQFLCW
ncbi:hypothetical protein J6590_009231 [Homalodisca vitripennis]|nr:hypothetical protein J6590_009231 [Homalodisca vitripennis]